MIMEKVEFCSYESPSVEWFLSPDEAGEGILCQSPTSNGDLGDITIGGEEGEDEGWLN